ncbi:interPro IPR001092 [Halorhodospira halochloris]|uniref:InterPro IPR001092 n=1 Tax=Halorhodospira halochloris TaxID=1052 RepID=A0A0X8X8A3_HALHR|nr:photosynthetic complex assembly protein PuhC [Halorhodospira halochloris]MCG5548070.1 hypothetical protein [Halorhodospira halochloris]BAU57301.1 interPro IPR001092 [Halorhodospira halochloris]
MSDEHLRAGVITNVVFPVTAFTAVALFTAYVIYGGLVLGHGSREGSVTSDAPVEFERGIFFDPLEDGGLIIRDHRGDELWSIAEDESAYIHSTAQRMWDYRDRDNVSATLPFIVRSHEDGQVIVSDPMTKRGVAINSFGSQNAEDFVDTLKAAE